MIQEIKRTNVQIMFNYDLFAQWNIPRTIIEDSDSQEQGGIAKEDADAQDAVLLIKDPLSKSLLWWILESIPTLDTFRDAEGRWVRTLR